MDANNKPIDPAPRIDIVGGGDTMDDVDTMDDDVGGMNVVPVEVDDRSFRIVYSIGVVTVWDHCEKRSRRGDGCRRTDTMMDGIIVASTIIVLVK